MVLLKTRVKAFFLEAGALLLVGIVTTLSSEQFAAIVTDHFGASVTTSLILLAVNALTKHVANVRAITKANSEFGANGSKPFILV